MSRRYTTPIPNGSAVTGPAVTYERPIPLPADAHNVSVTVINAMGTGPVPGAVDIVTDFAAYPSNGQGKVAAGAIPLASWPAVTVPGNGSPVTMPTAIANPVLGPDGKIVIVYGVDNASNVAVVAQCTYGFYTGGLQVNPPPDPTLLLDDPNPVYQIYLSFDSATANQLGKYFVEFGDSISIADIAATGFTIAAFNQVGASRGAVACILGMGGSSLALIADPATYPLLWNAPVDSVTVGVFEDCVNDLNSGAAVMIANLTAAVNHFKALGGSVFFTRTCAPQVSYPGTEADRLAFNTFVRANSLGAAGFYDAAASASSPLLGLADPGDPSVLNPPFSADGTHLTDAGQTQEANGWISIFSAFFVPSAGAGQYSSTIWPPLLYPPFPLPPPSSRNGGTAAPAPAPNMVSPTAAVARVSFTPAPTIQPRLTVISPTTTQKQINNFFRIVDLRLNNQGN
jgi:hypothetical protein